jgi:hypothetical protein
MVGSRRRLDEVIRAEAAKQYELQRQQEFARQAEEQLHREIAQQVETARFEEDRRRRMSS